MWYLCAVCATPEARARTMYLPLTVYRVSFACSTILFHCDISTFVKVLHLVLCKSLKPHHITSAREVVSVCICAWYSVILSVNRITQNFLMNSDTKIKILKKKKPCGGVVWAQVTNPFDFTQHPQRFSRSVSWSVGQKLTKSLIIEKVWLLKVYCVLSSCRK